MIDSLTEEELTGLDRVFFSQSSSMKSGLLSIVSCVDVKILR
jgi:hypothetical protein